LSEDDLFAARRAALEAELAGPEGKVRRLTLRPPLGPLAARAKAIQDRLLEAYQQRFLDTSDYPRSARSDFASCKSLVSKPSVNQP
jgi:hypothetical protein